MRDVPVIRTLLSHGHEVTIAACGNALASLRQEFPSCRFIPFEDYPAPYSAGRFFLPKLSLYFPMLLQAVARERRNTEKIIADGSYDLIISDNRLGVYSPGVPSLFITHQVRYHLPAALWPVDLFVSGLNRYHHKKFDRILIPDNPPGPASLAGKLSWSRPGDGRLPAWYTGILTSVPRLDVPQDLDYLVLISGPEPQRTRLEEILLPQVRDLDGSCVVLLGSPQRTQPAPGSVSCEVKAYVSNEEKALLMNRAKFVICRSGYTTMMELAALRKRSGLFIPTPGQPEQEYLSGWYEQNGWFHSQSQYSLDLRKDIPVAQQYRGFPEMPPVETGTERLYENVLAGYLE